MEAKICVSLKNRHPQPQLYLWRKETQCPCQEQSWYLDGASIGCSTAISAGAASILPNIEACASLFPRTRAMARPIHRLLSILSGFNHWTRPKADARP